MDPQVLREALPFEAAKLVEGLIATIQHPSATEELLQRYKLGLEMMGPPIVATLRKKTEISLQRELCRFLVEHGQKAVGTKFGRAETDLFVREPHSAIVIETKLAKRKDSGCAQESNSGPLPLASDQPATG